MLDIKFIRDNEEKARAALRARGVEAPLDELLALDKDRRALVTRTDTLKCERNAASERIGELKKRGEDTSAQQQAVKNIGAQIAQLDAELREIEERLERLALMIPNIPHSSVPLGGSAQDNKVVRTWGEQRKFDFEPKSHVDIAERLGIVDFARAARLAGSGFHVFVGAGARLERAMINFMLDLHTREHGYTELSTPFVCNTAAMTGTGQLPKLADDMYFIQKDGLYLIPTAEVPVTNFFREQIIDRPLPVKFVAYSPCFRREAGAAGRETRGLIRVHQFDKVELVKFVEPETSYAELESLVQNAEAVLQRLELPYRVMALCTADLSFAAAKCYDIELWAPGQKAWLEVSSCSNFEAFQARRAGIRFRTKSGKTDFAHTLNGSGVALARLLVAVLENYQLADGSVEIPAALAPYMDGCSALEPRH